MAIIFCSLWQLCSFFLYSYLNTHLKKQKQDYGEISPYSTSFSPDAMEEVMDIGAVSSSISPGSLHL